MLNWLVEYRFLSYSPYVEGAFCAACCLFSSSSVKNKAGLFVQQSCSQFRHLKHFSTVIKAHLGSDNHRLATIRAANFIRTFEDPSSSIDYQIDRQRNEMVERNKSIVLSVIKVVITCARQNLALRGHRDEGIASIRSQLDTVDSASGSNFISLLKQRVDAGDEQLRSHLEKGPRNATYTSASVQNEIIDLIYEHVLTSILSRVGQTTLYSLIVDGTSDVSNVEQLTFLIRYVDSESREIREDFLGFIPTDSTTGQAIADHILDCMKRFRLIPSNCVGQAYDGASAMSGMYNGCQAIIKRVCPDAEYMHCSSHSLNLALVDSCSSCFIRNMIGTIKSAIRFFNDSAKRTNALKCEIERPNNDYLPLTSKKRLLSLCDTRWVDRNVAVETFLELYIPISNTLESLRTERDTSAEQLYHSINSFEMIMCTCIACFLLSEITPLSRLLQTPSLDFGMAHHHVKSLLEAFDSREADAHAVFHNVVFEQAKEIANELFVQPLAPRSYQRRHGQSILEPEAFHREQVFLPFLRDLRANVNERLSVFGQSRIQFLTQLRPEHITSANCCTAELYKQLKEKFSDRLPQPLQLYGEIERWKKECICLVGQPGYAHL